MPKIYKFSGPGKTMSTICEACPQLAATLTDAKDALQLPDDEVLKLLETAYSGRRGAMGSHVIVVAKRKDTAIKQVRKWAEEHSINPDAMELDSVEPFTEGIIYEWDGDY